MSQSETTDTAYEMDRLECDLCHYEFDREQLSKFDTSRGRIAFACDQCREMLSGGVEFEPV